MAKTEVTRVLDDLARGYSRAAGKLLALDALHAVKWRHKLAQGDALGTAHTTRVIIISNPPNRKFKGVSAAQRAYVAGRCGR
jgi:hypothetical protein